MYFICVICIIWVRNKTKIRLSIVKLLLLIIITIIMNFNTKIPKVIFQTSKTEQPKYFSAKTLLMERK